MVRFKGHEINEEKNGYVEITLYLDTQSKGLEEFSAELGHREEVEVEKAALNYVKKNFPNTKVKKIKVMVGGIMVASILGMGLGAPGTLAAESVSGEVGITGKEKTISTLEVGTFEAVILNGKTQSINTTINDLTVTDPSGTGNGWTVTMTATPFTDTSKPQGTRGRTLPSGLLTVADPTLTDADPLSGSSPAANIAKTGGPIDVAGGLDILTAAEGEGMGSYLVKFETNDLTLKLPPNAVYSGTYTSTISVEFSSGPSPDTGTAT